MDATMEHDSREYWLARSIRAKKFCLLFVLLATCVNVVSIVSSIKENVGQKLTDHKQILFSELFSGFQLFLAVTSIIYLTIKMHLMGNKSRAYAEEVLESGSLFSETSHSIEGNLAYSLKPDSLHMDSISTIGHNQIEHPSRLPLIQPIPHDRDQYPSDFLILTSVLFAMPSCFSTVTDAACKIISTDDSSWDYSNLLMFECLRLVLLSSFIICQSGFFATYGRKCVNSNKKSTVFAMSLVLSANISSWLFTVGHEISYVLKEPHSDKSNFTTYCSTINAVVVKSLYPILIEYYVMNALFALSFIGNTGCKDAIQQSAAQIRHLLNAMLNSHLNCRLGAFKCRHGFGITLSISMIFFSFALYLGHSVYPSLSVAMGYILIITHSFAVAALLTIIVHSMYKNQNYEDTINAHLHSIEIIPLWVATCAVLLHDFYKIGNNISHVSRKLPEVVSCVMNSMQCTLQSAFLHGFVPIRINAKTDLVLLLLMLTNALEWCIYTAYFAKLFPQNWHEGLVIAVISSPLLVFFRFHCIGCFDQVRVPSGIEKRIRNYTPMNLLLKMSGIRAHT